MNACFGGDFVIIPIVVPIQMITAAFHIGRHIPLRIGQFALVEVV